MNTNDRARMCALMAECLADYVNGYNEVDPEIYLNAGYETPKNAQLNKTAIHRQIVALRQELLALDKEVAG